MSDQCFQIAGPPGQCGQRTVHAFLEPVQVAGAEVDGKGGEQDQDSGEDVEGEHRHADAGRADDSLQGREQVQVNVASLHRDGILDRLDLVDHLRPAQHRRRQRRDGVGQLTVQRRSGLAHRLIPEAADNLRQRFPGPDADRNCDQYWCQPGRGVSG
jgi:hypothetical protein